MPIQTSHSLAAATLAEQAYEILKQEIICGNLAPGEKLNIHEISSRLHISRTPVKEAFNRLAQQGLVTIRSRKSTFVSTVSAAKIREAFDLRLMVELWGAERAYAQPGLLDLPRLKDGLEICDSLFTAEDSFDYETFNQLDTELHLDIVKAAENKRLLEFYDSLSVHIQGMRVYWGDARRPALNSHHEHIEIVESFRRGTLEQVKNSLTTHIINSRDDVLRVLNESSS